MKSISRRHTLIYNWFKANTTCGLELSRKDPVSNRSPLPMAEACFSNLRLPTLPTKIYVTRFGKILCMQFFPKNELDRP